MTFREEQCAAKNGKHFNINGLPPSVKWVPKYAGSKWIGHTSFSILYKKLCCFTVSLSFIVIFCTLAQAL